MKIALISTPFFGTPPPTYGGLEVVVWNLANGLTKLGHKVVLFAPKGSKVPKNGFLVECGKAYNTVNVDWIEAERNMWKVYDKKLDDFDIVNGHDWFGFEYASKVRNPSLKVCHTHHGGLNLNWWKRSKPPFKLNLVAISKWMKEVYKDQGFESKHVYNGVDLSQYPFSENKGDRLLFLGRISKIKAPHLAIEVAKKLDMGLDIIGGTSFVDDPNYVEEVKRMCDGEKIKFIGEVEHSVKVRYLQEAKALLIPSRFGEPFGLIAVESMACGTPPIALDDGALKEIIEDGKSGFICKDVEEMIKKVEEIDTINLKDCRERSKLFSKEVMSRNYVEEIYKPILNGEEW